MTEVLAVMLFLFAILALVRCYPETRAGMTPCAFCDWVSVITLAVVVVGFAFAAVITHGGI